MIEREHALPLTRQSEILELSRSSLYYKAVPFSAGDLELMRLIDELHLKHPYMGSRSIRDQLQDKGHQVGRGHVSTLMKKMGISALYMKPRLSKPHPDHKVYPYLLKGVEIIRGNQVWATDITYLPMAKGFCYLVAIMDWASRRVLAWRLSNTLDVTFCTEALEEAIMRHASATGGLRSGNVQEAMYDYNTQLQNQALLQSYNQQLQGLQGLAGLPSYAPQIASGMAGVGQTLGQGVSGAGQTIAQGQVAAGQAQQQGLQGISSIIGAGMGQIAGLPRI